MVHNNMSLSQTNEYYIEYYDSLIDILKYIYDNRETIPQDTWERLSIKGCNIINKIKKILPEETIKNIIIPEHLNNMLNYPFTVSNLLQITLYS